MSKLNASQKLKTATTNLTTVPSGILQRKCASCNTRTIAGGKCEDCQSKQVVLQRKSLDSTEQLNVPPVVQEVLRSSGEPLDNKTRGFFESRFEHNFSNVPVSSTAQQVSTSSLTISEPMDPHEQEANRLADSIMSKDGHENKISLANQRADHKQDGKFDLSRVRIHTDPHAAESARAVHARAYTVGHNIVFGAGQFAPKTHSGRQLIAHELTHVAQQAQSSQSIQRLIRTPYPWRGVITPAIGANLRSSPNSSAPSNILYAIPRGQFVTVTSASGNWLEVKSRYTGPQVTGYIHHTLVDDAASASMESTVGTTMVWQPSEPGSGTDFETWASAPTETPFPAVTATTVMNCWEAVLLSAYRSGAISWNWIHNLYTSVPTADWAATMSRGALHGYAVPGPNLHIPQRGDIVFFDGIAHVALATGNGSEVYTFWPPPNTPFTLGGTTDQVKVFTIEDLVLWWEANMGSSPVVEFGAPSW